MSTKKIARIALFSAILFVSQVILAVLPNVEVVSFLIILFTILYGKEMYLTVTIFTMLEGLLYGFGMWWASYLYVWPILVTLVLLLKKMIKEDFVLWAVVSGAFGLIFGTLFAIGYIPIDLSVAFSYWISGLLWDVWHGICNFLIMLLIGKTVYKAMKKTRFIND